MSAKDIHFRETAAPDVLKGVTTLAAAVEVTLGPGLFKCPLDGPKTALLALQNRSFRHT